MVDLRRDLQVIFDAIPNGSRVLDLGCGSGELLAALKLHKAVEVQGIDHNFSAIASCAQAGIPVIHGAIGPVLSSYPDNAFDYVILSHTLQVMSNPEKILKQMTRVGKHGIVSIINIGYIKSRIQLCFGGRMPKNRDLPHHWYNTPNIHLGTVKDFQDLCSDLDITIEKCRPLKHLIHGQSFMANLFAREAMFFIK